jgi:hypothetical protein
MYDTVRREVVRLQHARAVDKNCLIKERHFDGLTLQGGDALVVDQVL